MRGVEREQEGAASALLTRVVELERVSATRLFAGWSLANHGVSALAFRLPLATYHHDAPPFAAPTELLPTIRVCPKRGEELSTTSEESC